jgi:hypothetical protein
MIVQYMAMERQFCGLRPEFIDQKKSCWTQIRYKLLEINATGQKNLPECLPVTDSLQKFESYFRVKLWGHPSFPPTPCLGIYCCIPLVLVI